MSDDELDREWKPSSRRPLSTMALSFSAALDDLFRIDNSVADLDAAVERKKRSVSSQTSELQALEARLKATEERLRQRQSMSPAMGLSLSLAIARYGPLPSAEPNPPPPRAADLEPVSEPVTEPQPEPLPESRRESQHDHRPRSRKDSHSDRRPEPTRDSRHGHDSRPRTSNRPSTSRRHVPTTTTPSARPLASPTTPRSSESDKNGNISDGMRSWSSRSSAEYVVVRQDSNSETSVR